ncbi:MAG: hypothetical protein SVZ03_04685 [Spirochaetota bacterium]|nr:hypothetical protein [Spirochaetota bacterium]
MKVKILHCFVLALFIISFNSCGKEKNNEIYLSGTLEIEDDILGPAFLAIATTDDFDKIENDPQNHIIGIYSVEPYDYDFYLDISDTELSTGQEVFIFGFVDNDYIYEIPNPTEGDYVGFYFQKENWQTSYILKEGYNDNINIRVNRRVYDFDAEVSGTIQGDYSGDVILVAYAGELNSFNFNDFDIDGIVGYKRTYKSGSPLPYTMKIMPYGHNVPIENVFLIAMYDKNSNGKPDGNDMIGFHSEEENQLPTLITINNGSISNKHIETKMTLPVPSGYDHPVYGSFNMPEGEVYCNDSEFVYIIIAETDDPNKIMDDPLNAVKYFEKIPLPEMKTDTVDFNIMLSETDLEAGDKIFIFALWEKDSVAGFPYPTKGDYVGFYINTEAMTPQYTLRNDGNENIQFKINRRVYDYESEISGSISGSDTGELTIVAYAGEINSFDLKNAIDFDSVIGFQTIYKDKTNLDYNLKILPYGKDVPINNVYVIAFLDKNGNGIPDGKDIVGFHTEDEHHLPALLTINKGALANKKIEMLMELPDPAGYDVPLSGSFEIPEGVVLNDDPTKALFLLVAATDDPNEIFENPLGTVRYFEKIQPMTTGTNEIDFLISLTETDNVAGDDVFIMAYLDMNYHAGLSFPGDGDYVGFYMNAEEFSPTYKLKEVENDQINFKLDRKAYSFDSEINGTIIGDDAGELTIVAYAGEINSFDLENAIEFDAVIGYLKTEKKGFDLDYTLKILPFGSDVPVEDVFIISFLDNNYNGKPDGGDKVGFYIKEQQNSGYTMQVPSTIRVDEGQLNNIDMKMLFNIPIPSGFNISLEGSFEKPDGYNENSPPVFLMVAQADDIAIMFEDPLNAIKYFYKMPPGVNTFNIDLSITDIVPGDPEDLKDDVVILAIWDKDSDGGFLDPTEGDYVGYVQSNEAYAYSVNLQDGVNTIPSNGFEFKLNKRFYQHNSSVTFWLDKGLFSGGLYDGDNIMIVAIHKDGVNYSSMEMDIDYVIANMTFDAKFGQENKFNLKIFPIIYEGIPVQEPFAIDDIFIFAIHDSNRNESPDEGERLAFYWYCPFWFLYLPDYWDLFDEENLLSRSIRFSEFFTL